jgi:hypothetical protein
LRIEGLIQTAVSIQSCNVPAVGAVDGLKGTADENFSVALPRQSRDEEICSGNGARFRSELNIQGSVFGQARQSASRFALCIGEIATDDHLSIWLLQERSNTTAHELSGIERCVDLSRLAVRPSH